MICENCGKTLENNDTVVSTKEDGTTHFFCRNCAALFGTCAMCAHTYCGFFNDPDSMPQFVMIARQVRQGSVTLVEQAQVPNSDRVKKFCVEGNCKCLMGMPDKPLCCRHGGYTTCTKYCEKEQFNFSQNFPKQIANEN